MPGLEKVLLAPGVDRTGLFITLVAINPYDPIFTDIYRSYFIVGAFSITDLPFSPPGLLEYMDFNVQTIGKTAKIAFDP
jgi:hypothetical protein